MIIVVHGFNIMELIDHVASKEYCIPRDLKELSAYLRLMDR